MNIITKLKELLDASLLDIVLVSFCILLCLLILFFTPFGKRLLNKADLQGTSYRSMHLDVPSLKAFWSPDKLFFIFALFVGGVAIAISFLRALKTGMTYDEVYTVHQYAQSSFLASFVYGQLLNNHILNSLCIRIVMFLSKMEYNELLIRLPNLIFYSVYAVFAYHIAKGFPCRFLIFTLFLSNYYLNEFFGLARGYGMACACIAGACYFFEKWKTAYQDRRVDTIPFLMFLLLCTLAALSNSITLYAIFCFLVIINFKYRKDIVQWLNLPFFLGFVLVFIHTVMVSGKELPVFSTHSFYPCFMSIPWMFVSSQGASYLVALLFLVLFSWLMIATKGKDDYAWVLVGIFVICVISQLVFHRGYPLERAMLPFYPIFIMVVAHALRNMPEFKVRGALVTVCTVLLLFQFLIKVDTTKTKDWCDNYPIRDTVYSYVISHDVRANPEEFLSFIRECKQENRKNPTYDFYARKVMRFLEDTAEE